MITQLHYYDLPLIIIPPSLRIEIVNTTAPLYQHMQAVTHKKIIPSAHGFSLSSHDFLLQLEPAVASARVSVFFKAMQFCLILNMGINLHCITYKHYQMVIVSLKI